MSFGKKLRSSSASGRLETARVTSILSELGCPEIRTRNEPGPGGRTEKTEDLSVPRPAGGVKEKQPDWLVRELLKQNKRRHSVPDGEKARQQHYEAHSSRSLETDEKMSLDNLQKLKSAFEEFENRGTRGVSVKTFGHLLRKAQALPNMSDAQIHGLFKKVDSSAQGRISWGEFSSYVLQGYKEKEEAVRRSKQVAFSLPALVRNCDYGVPIVNIRCADDGAAVTVREDGFICLWNPELKPQKTKYVFGEGAANRKAKWVSDFALMLEHNKLMIGTGDREIQVYDLFTLEPYCQINSLSSIPLTLDYSCTGSDECCILYGDTEGCVTILLMSSVDDTLRKWSKLPLMENIPSITVENAVLAQQVTFVRWKVHHDWVTQVKYFHSFRAVVSSSNEESSSLVVGCVLPFTDSAQQLKEITEVCSEDKTRKDQLSWTPQVRASCDQTSFSIHKGVKTFDLCQKHSLLVTGGMDRLVRMWNPYFSGKPKCVLKGHSAPIFRLYISSEDSQIFSVSVDSTVKIWHIEDQCCLFTAEPKASGIHGDVSAASYSPALKLLYVAADSMALLTLKSRPRFHSRMHVSHNKPVRCCGCSEELRQVVSCSQGSVAKVWDLDTGREIFEFGCTDDLNSITCMTFDSTGRRLITGGRDGCLKMWNFNNGQCLKTFKKEGKELWDCIFVEVQTNFYVTAVGRDRRVHVYLDVPQESHHTQRSPPSWKDDLLSVTAGHSSLWMNHRRENRFPPYDPLEETNGHKEEILCVEWCPPSLLATSSYDGEIIVWNFVSGCVQCRFAGPLEAEDQKTEGLDTSVPSIIFLKNFKLHPSTTALLSSGVKGRVNLWSVLAGGKLISSFEVPQLTFIPAASITSAR